MLQTTKTVLQRKNPAEYCGLMITAGCNLIIWLSKASLNKKRVTRFLRHPLFPLLIIVSVYLQKFTLFILAD